jgi:hypothetical protein
MVVLLIALVFSCGETGDTKENKQIGMNEASQPPPKDETAVMVERLRNLVISGDPTELYHWNGRLAELYKAKLPQMRGGNRMHVWFRYCEAMMNAGNPQSCIDEILKLLENKGQTPETFLEKKNQAIVELLALAYLRLGENENCQENHNEYACILPLKKEAFHLSRTGSENAIQIYTLLQEKYPNDKYLWLMNLAYMTLGEYPDGVPAKYLITYPNWNLEQKNFPAFKEVAIGLGLAENGLSGGVCIDDFNNDGYLDIFATSYGMSDQVKLFMGNGSGFEDNTQSAGLNGIVSGLNCIHADYDNDGDRDILILRGAWLAKGGNHPNSLLRNNGDGTFTDVTESAGLLSFHPTQTATWSDVDRDGYLDLFIGNESGRDVTNPCELYINQKDGTFKEESELRGLGNIQAFVKGVTFGDVDNDLWPDLYISVLGGKNIMFKNHQGQFEDVSATSRTEGPLFSFPCWFWDVNNDGYQDLFVSGYDLRNLRDLAEEYSKELQGKLLNSAMPRLYINMKDGTFDDQTATYGLDKTMYAMGANFGDLDNDGWLDFYVGTGAPDFSTVVPNRMFRSLEGKKFEEVTSAGRFGHIQKGHGISFADLDRDGDQDIYAVMGGAFEGDAFTNVLFENPIEVNNWVVIALDGVQTNKDAIGTVINLELDNGREIHYTVNTGGSFGANSLQAEIGLGKADLISKMTIHWQNSEAQVFNDVAVGKKYSLKEGELELLEMDYTSFKMEGDEHAHHEHHH